MPNPRHRVPLATVLAALAGACGLAAPPAPADQPVPAADAAWETLTVATHAGAARFRAQTPDAPSTPATRDDTALVNPDGTSLGWTPGWVLHARVIVRTADAKAAASAATLGNAKLTPASPDNRPGPLREFFYLDCATVRQAVALAALLTGAKPVAGITEAYLDLESPKVLRNNIPTDPGLAQQWHLINTTTPAADTNADVAWKAGFTGSGVTVGVLEAGWDVTHEDLVANYSDPASQPFRGQTDHGTGTAGLVAAVANNGLGGVGVAWGAKVSRLYYGTATDIVTAFGFRNDLNKVKTNSWGPPDNGFIATISSIELAGIEDAALNGRGGLGEVIIWAAGNGGQTNNDRVDYDPYGSNRWSIAVGAVDWLDRHALYSEPGSALMLVTTSDYDFNTPNVSGIYTTWGFNTYTTSFGGTSAASPIAAGVAALVLQANPNLTWRDVQHVLIRSARRVNPADPTWGFNAAGAGNLRAWSEIYGFGAIDAGAATALAQTWVNRPTEQTLVTPTVNNNPPVPIPDNSTTGVSSGITVLSPMIVERVQVVLTAPHTRVGQLRVTLTSPGGTVATLAAPRNDTTPNGYSAYTFTPVRFWDERAAGTWTIRLADEVASPAATGSFTSWQLKVYGYTPACRCDWNLSGGPVTIQDLFDFLVSYFSGRGDFNADGATTVQDIFDFLGCWFAGC